MIWEAEKQEAQGTASSANPALKQAFAEVEILTGINVVNVHGREKLTTAILHKLYEKVIQPKLFSSTLLKGNYPGGMIKMLQRMFVMLDNEHRQPLSLRPN